MGARSITAGLAPGLPDSERMFAPGTFPASAASGLLDGTFARSSAFTVLTENGTLVCSVAPVTPVMTTSWSRLMSSRNEKSADWGPSASTIGLESGIKPMWRARRVTDWPFARPAGTTIVYRPSLFVPTEMFSSGITTLVLDRARPSADTTLPVIVACAHAERGANTISEVRIVNAMLRVRFIRMLACSNARLSGLAAVFLADALLRFGRPFWCARLHD